MSRIKDIIDSEITNSASPITFRKTGKENWENWNRFILIDGKPAYEIGNICGTCGFYFERLEGASGTINPINTIQQLNEGITKIKPELIETISNIIPDGKYKVLLLTIKPELVELGSKNDYFSNEQVKLWGIDGFWGIPHYPKVKYYRGTDQSINVDEQVYEIIIPIYAQTWLDESRVEYYVNEMNNGSLPCALSLSILDVKAPAVWLNDTKPGVTKHWCLAHYILDGHHKLYAAAKLKKSINLISFLSINESIRDTEMDIDSLISII